MKFLRVSVLAAVTGVEIEVSALVPFPYIR